MLILKFIQKYKISIFTFYLITIGVCIPNLGYGFWNNNHSFVKNYKFINPINENTEHWHVGKPGATRQDLIDLGKAPGPLLKPDKTFLFESPGANEGFTDYYNIIHGSNKDDIVRFKGRFVIDRLDLLSGKNTLVLEANTSFFLNPGRNGYPNSGLKFYNIANFDLHSGVKMQMLQAIYGEHDININFYSQDSLNKENDIKLQELVLVNTKSAKKGYININNAKVVIEYNTKNNMGGNFILSSNNETLTLADAKIDDKGVVDGKTQSELIVTRGFSKPDGIFTLNMGKYSSITTLDGCMQISGPNTTINMDKSSTIQSHMLFRGYGNVNINIKDNSRSEGIDQYNTPITIHGINFENSNGVINIGKNSSFLINSTLESGRGKVKIFVGQNSDFTIQGEVGLNYFANYIYLDEQSVLNANMKFTSISYDNSVVVNTGNSFVTLNGFLNAYGGNNSLKLLGLGTFKVNNQLGDIALLGFNNIDLGKGKIEFSNLYLQHNNLNINLTLLDNTKVETTPRLWFAKLAQFEGSSISIKLKGVTEFLGNINDKYTLTLFRVGDVDYKDFTKLSDIGLENINFKSAIYKYEYYIDQGRDLKLNFEKYRSFKDAIVQDGNISHKEEYIVQIANFLDLLVKNKKYFAILDSLAMLDVFELKDFLIKGGLPPVDNTLLFVVNANQASFFNNIVLEEKPYKIVKDKISLWSKYSYYKMNLKNLYESEFTNNNNLMMGIEYSLLDIFKIGSSIGYSTPYIKATGNYYDAKINNFYYSLYGISSISKQLSFDFNVGFLNSNYDLRRYIKVEVPTVTSKPKFKQITVDTLLTYKIKFHNLLISPYISLGYKAAYMNTYKENGDLFAYQIMNSNFHEIQGGFGLKALTMTPCAGGIFIPNLVLGLYSTYQTNKSTKSRMLDATELDLPSTQSYNGIYGKCRLGVAYRMHNLFTLDFNSGANIGSSLSSYDISFSIKLEF